MGESFQGSDRRKAKRVRVSLSVIYRINEPLDVRFLTTNKEVKATMLDLSERGMAILTDLSVPINTVLLMRFTLFKVDAQDVSFYGPVEIEGTVRYSVKEGTEFRLGVEFTKIEAEDQKEISNFAQAAIAALNKDSLQ